MSAETHSEHRSYAGLGTLLLFGGLILLVLCGIESAEGVPGMPRFWYSNRILWWAMGLGSVVAGVRCLLPVDTTPHVRWKPSRPGIRFQHVLVYTRSGCHLCDDALQLLAAHQRWLPAITELDIDHDADLAAKFGNCVPVVVCDGKVRFRGRVAPALLQRLIEGTPPR
jgi:glutaredoxin